ncbi:PD-(D/E)XK motif protein [Vibrio lentus]|uniref:PD-(D/E)XK motif protein n=1 Tax=Vibrio lentus TaxID=136468 RepID=UPI0010BE0379|nr:PD-(D/E)XK motif protein [Vibrio lentus]TKF53085.1 PD-(D/E)XK motif protein [Vibrio lentus]
MSKYDEFFDDNPWKNIVEPTYPKGYRLFLNDDRFWVSMDNDGKILFFIHDKNTGKVKLPENLAGVRIELVEYADDAKRLICTLTSNEIELQNKFCIVTKDIAYRCTGLTGSLLFNKVIELIKSWANFLRPQRCGLSESEYIGLWGELYTFAKLILPHHTPINSLRFWVGPEGKKQDFTLNNIAIEVKTSLSSEARKITISSLEQLDVITDELYLLHIIANPSDAKSGYSLKDLYENSLSIVNQDQSSEILFIKKVFELYGRASEKQLNIKNILIKQTLYEVNDSFPCLRHKDVPSAISGLQYSLLVSAIREHESKKSIEEIINNG